MFGTLTTILIKKKHRKTFLNLNRSLAVRQSSDCDVACGLVTLDPPEIRAESRDAAQQTASLSFLSTPLITTASFPAEVVIQETTS